MDKATLVVSRAGPLVTFQDGGRGKLMRFGIPASGAMDPTSFSIANLAVGNDRNAAAIEISVAGLALECVEGSVTAAVTGGDFKAVLDQDTLGAWHVFTLQAGSRLVVKPGSWGSWAYLAFAGQLHANTWLDSVSTHAPSGLGGGQLIEGQEITVNNTKVFGGRSGRIPYPMFAMPRKVFSVVLGPQDHLFSKQTTALLLTERFALTAAYDRMGVRMNGPCLYPAIALDLPSEAIVRGSIQVSGDGVATVLLSDHQTTGGYPKIATMISSEMDRFAQLRSHDEIEFTQVTPQAAVHMARAKHEAYDDFLDNLGRLLSCL